MGKRRKFNCIYGLFGPDKTVYIGQTSDPINRRSRYRTLTCQNQTAVYESLLKHGFKKHKFQIILELSDFANRDEMDFYEKFYYSLYQEVGYKMLNLKSPGWNGRPGELSKQRLSVAHKGQVAWNKGKRGVQIAWNKGLTKKDYGQR